MFLSTTVLSWAAERDPCADETGFFAMSPRSVVRCIISTESVTV